MKILLPYDDTICVNIALAKEVGLYEAAALLTIYKEIEQKGVNKDGNRMIARKESELKDLFPWCRNIDLIRKTLDRLTSKGYLYISDNTLFDDDYLWYGLNVNKLREIKSLTILFNEEIKEMHISPAPRKVETNGNGNSLLYKEVYAAMLETCHWNLAPNLSSRDRAEAGAVTKWLVDQYSDLEIDSVVAMVKGIDIYRQTILKQARPFSPSGVMRAWTDYVIYCRKYLNGTPPGVR